MKNIGDVIKLARKQKAMTQEDLSHAIGVSRQAISKWESNETKPDLENVYKLCNVLELTVDDFDLPRHKSMFKWNARYTWLLVGIVLGLVCGIGIGRIIHTSDIEISKHMFITQNASINTSHTLAYTALSSVDLSDMDIMCIYDIAGEKYVVDARIDGYEVSCNKRIAKGDRVDIYLEVDDTLMYMYVVDYNINGSSYMHYPVE